MTRIALHSDRLAAVDRELAAASAELSTAGNPAEAANLAMVPATLRLDRAIAGLTGELGRVGSSFAAETTEFDADMRAAAADLNTIDQDGADTFGTAG